MGDSRLTELRKMRGLTQAALGARIGTSQQQIDRLESRALNEKWIADLSPGLDVAPADLLAPAGAPLSVPVRYAVGLALSEGVDGRSDIDGGEADWLAAPPGLRHSESCVAARVIDDSCDRLYPPGSIVISRRLDAVDRPLRIGDKVLVRRFATSRSDGRTYEILIGRLDRNAAGEISVLLRSTNRQAPAAVTVRSLPSTGGIAERFIPYHAGNQPAAIAYEPEDDDPAEIIGLIVMAITPE